MAELLAISGLHAGYGATEILRGIDLAVNEGEIVAVLGSNGAGKSTLNRTISGALRPWRGAIRFGGAPIERAKPSAIVAQGLIHVPEGRRIFPNMSVSREPRSRLLPPRPRAPRGKPRARVRDLPAARRTAVAERRHAVGRRAADAGDRARADGGAEAADPRRALARALAAAGRGAVRADQAHQRAGHRAAAGRAERGAEPGGRKPRLRARQRRDSCCREAPPRCATIPTSSAPISECE